MSALSRAIRQAWCWMRGSCELGRPPDEPEPTPIRQWLAEQEQAARQATFERKRRQNAMERLHREARRECQ